MVNFGQKTAFFGPWNETKKNTTHGGKKKNTTFGSKKTAQSWTWNRHLANFIPNFGHETTILLKNFNTFPKNKNLEATNGFKNTCQMKVVVSKNLSKSKIQ